MVIINMRASIRSWIYFQRKLTGFADRLGVGSERTVKNEAKLWV